jgi:uncharacterized OB-fold protein
VEVPDLSQTASVPLPLPLPDATTQFFWDGLREHRLLIQRCGDCGFYIHYPREVCRNCFSTNLAPSEVSGHATLYTWTVCVQPFHPFFVDRVPFILATVTLDEQEGLQFLTNVVDCSEDELVIGMPLEVVFEDFAPELTVPWFRPAPVEGR